MPGVYEYLEAKRITYAIRLTANRVLQAKESILDRRDSRTRSGNNRPVDPLLGSGIEVDATFCQ